MLAEPRCYSDKCKHYLGVKDIGEGEETEVNFCKAFPDGIPNEIAYSEEETFHIKVVKGQEDNFIYTKE